MNVLIVNYNTQELTECAIKSLNLHTPGCRVYVFDNSDKGAFVNYFKNVEVIDNTAGQIINWRRWLRTYPEKYPYVGNNYGSAKHCKSVDLCFELIPDGFVLMDSDILIKQDISTLWDESCAASGKVVCDEHFISIPRLAPYLCYINVPMCREHGVWYFNAAYMWKLTRHSPNRFYDTGAWLLKDVEKKGLPIKKVDIDNYAAHLRNGSWKDTDYRQWLEDNVDLWAT